MADFRFVKPDADTRWIGYLAPTGVDILSGPSLRLLRQIHNYIGAFFAPAILFYAFSGAFQTFSLHENHGGSDYQPPAWIVTIASIHKDQRFPRYGTPHSDRAPRREPPDVRRAEAGPSPLPLKLFVLCLATGLILSTLIGLMLALSNRASRRWTLIMLALGSIVPMAFLLL
jgi:hypothetical protein